VLVLFVVGYYSGRLIAIETVCLFQLTFYGLLGVNDLSPTFYGLTFLKFSKGYSIEITSFEVDIDRVC
jgi:hypothetical protein